MESNFSLGGKRFFPLCNATLQAVPAAVGSEAGAAGIMRKA